MPFSQLTALLFLLLLPVLVHAAPAVPEPATNSSTPCSPAVAALASGISANIAVQSSEAAGAASLAKLLAVTPLDTAAFATSQKSLLGFVQKGIAIRQNNQKITPAGNAAIMGLATVAMAQMEELDLTKSLGNRTVIVVNATKTVETLKKDFAGGIVQNMKNLAAAKGNCTA